MGFDFEDVPTPASGYGCFAMIVTILVALIGGDMGFLMLPDALNEVAGIQGAAAPATGNTAVVNPAPQFTLPGPQPSVAAPVPAPQNSQPAPNGGGGSPIGGGAAAPPSACTPLVPGTVSFTDDTGTHSAPSNGNYAAHSKSPGDRVTVTLSGYKACPGKHVALTIRDHPNNFSCNFGSGSGPPITVSIGAYSVDEQVTITAVYGDGC